MEITYYNEQWEAVKVALDEVIDNNDTWSKGKVKILSYDWCKRIAHFCGIQECKNPAPNLMCTPIEGNMQQHVWGLFLEFKNNASVYTFAEWEASKLNTWEFTMVVDSQGNKRQKHNEWTKIDAQYKSNLAYKRAYCRWVIKLVWLKGLYVEVEAPSFANEKVNI